MKLSDEEISYIYPIITVVMIFNLISAFLRGKTFGTVFLDEFRKDKNPFGYYSSIIFYVVAIIIGIFGTYSYLMK